MFEGPIGTALAVIVFLGTAMLFHEAGHFLMARLFRIRVTHFALGVGPVIGKMKRGDTEYSLRAIPFAAYVKIIGMEPGEEHDPGSIYKSPVIGRLLTILSGAAMNFVLACILLTSIGLVWGLGQGVAVVGFTPDSPARIAGLQEGDVVIALDDKPIESSVDLLKGVAPKPEQEVTITVVRNREPRSFALTTTKAPLEEGQAKELGLPEEAKERGMLGVEQMTTSYRTKASLGAYVFHGVRETVFFTRETLGFVWRLIAGRRAPGEQVMGPVGIVHTVNSFVKLGLQPLLWLFAALNISIGIFNLLPIPMFDGGRFVIMVIEGIRGRLFDKQKEAMVHFVGLVLVVMFAIAVSISDVKRIRNGESPLDEAIEQAEIAEQAEQAEQADPEVAAPETPVAPEEPVAAPTSDE